MPARPRANHESCSQRMGMAGRSRCEIEYTEPFAWNLGPIRPLLERTVCIWRSFASCKAPFVSIETNIVPRHKLKPLGHEARSTGSSIFQRHLDLALYVVVVVGWFFFPVLVVAWTCYASPPTVVYCEARSTEHFELDFLRPRLQILLISQIRQILFILLLIEIQPILFILLFTLLVTFFQLRIRFFKLFLEITNLQKRR